MRSYSSESAGRGLDTITGKAIILSYLHFSGCNLVTEETIKIKMSRLLGRKKVFCPGQI